MKFSIDRVTLNSALNKASLSLPSKPFSEILTNYVFELEDGVLTISATDTTTTISTSEDVLDAEQSSYRALLPADKVRKIAQTAHEGEIIFDIAPRKAVISSRSSEWVLNLFDAAQYPQINKPSNLSWKPVSRVPFLKALNAVSPAASFDSSSPGLCMVNISGGVFRASDRARMHQVESEYGVPDFSIPSFGLKTLTSLLKMSSSEEFEVIRGTNGFMVKTDNTFLTVAGLDAEFPDVTGVLLKPTLVNSVEVTVDSEDLTKAISRTRVTVDPETRVLNIKISPTGMSVSTKENITNSRATEKVEIGYAGKESVEVNINAHHMYAALAAAPTTNVTMTFGKKENTKLPSVRLIADDGMYNAVLSQVRTDIL